MIMNNDNVPALASSSEQKIASSEALVCVEELRHLWSPEYDPGECEVSSGV